MVNSFTCSADRPFTFGAQSVDVLLDAGVPWRTGREPLARGVVVLLHVSFQAGEGDRLTRRPRLRATEVQLLAVRAKPQLPRSDATTAGQDVPEKRRVGRKGSAAPSADVVNEPPGARPGARRAGAAAPRVRPWRGRGR